VALAEEAEVTSHSLERLAGLKSGAYIKSKSSTSEALLRGGRDFLDVNGFLGGMELAGEQDVGGGEVLDGFGVFDDPDGLIGVGDEDGALGFPFGVTDGSAATPTFLDAIGAAGLGVLGGARFIADPAGPRCILLLGGQ